jgi:peptidoglycan/LPS O-acetylase OafA/YrhL
LAVDFFFMLSGFVLAHGYAQKLDAGGAVGSYLRARLVRLFPLIILGAGLAAVSALLHGMDAAAVARLATFEALSIPCFDQARAIMPLLPPAWSLFFELVASLAFGLGLWRGRFATIAVIAGFIAFEAFVLYFGRVTLGYDRATFMAGFARVAFGFGLGTWLYRCRIHVPRLPLWSLVLILALVLGNPFNGALAQMVTVFLVFPLIVLSASRVDTSSRVCVMAGDLSYPLYMLHWPVYLLFGQLQPARSGAIAAAAFVAACVVSGLILKLYDEPLRARLSALRIGQVATVS